MSEIISINQFDEENLRDMYLKVVSEPNEGHLHRGFIVCPDCGEEILMLPALRKMNEAIENHVQIHKESLKSQPLIKQHKAMFIRLDLAQQVLTQASLSYLI